MSLEEFDQEPDVRERGYVQRRSFMDIGMGLLWSGMGVFLVLIEKFSPSLAALYGDAMYKWLGGVFVLYGAFRIYRGLKKDYFKNES